MLNQLIDDFYDVLFKPQKGMKRIAADRTVWHGLLIYLVVSLVTFLSSIGTADPADLGRELGQFLPQETVSLFLRSSPVISLISIVLFAPLLLFVWSAILQFSAELLGGKGRSTNLAATVGYAQLPYILVAPLSLVVRHLPFDVVGLATFAAFIWSILLKIEAIKAVNDFSWRRAALAYFLPILILIIIVIIFFLLMGAFLMPLVMQLFPLQ